MLTMVVAVVLGVLAAWGSGTALDNRAWGVLIGIAVLLAVQLGIGLFIRRRVGKVNAAIQADMQAMQTKLQKKLSQLQSRPGASQKMLQSILEKDQTAAVHQALTMLDGLDKYNWWSPLLSRQINTMRMMFHYQIREFDAVDRLLPKCFFMAPASCAMKLARMYRKNDPGLDKFARKKLKIARGDAGALLYALYSWILVKRGEIPEAIKVLNDSRRRCDHEVLRTNWERLANNKVKNFSNSGFGEMWYMLYLEEPKIKTQRVRPQF